MAFAKLKAVTRGAATRTYHELWRAGGNFCDLCAEDECYIFLNAAGYETD